MARISAAKFTNRDILVTGTDPSTGEYLSAAQKKALFRKKKISSNQIFRKPGAIVKVGPSAITPDAGAGVKARSSAITPGAGAGVNVNVLNVRVIAIEKQVAFLAKALDKEAELEKKSQRDYEKKALQQEEKKLRSGEEKQLEKKLSDTLVSPVKTIGRKAGGVLGNLMEFFGILFAGWLTNQGMLALEANAEGNTAKLEEIKNRVIKDLAIVTGIFATLNGGLFVILGIIGSITARILTKPFRALIDAFRGGEKPNQPKPNQPKPNSGGGLSGAIRQFGRRLGIGANAYTSPIGPQPLDSGPRGLGGWAKAGAGETGDVFGNVPRLESGQTKGPLDRVKRFFRGKLEQFRNTKGGRGITQAINAIKGSWFGKVAGFFFKPFIKAFEWGKNILKPQNLKKVGDGLGKTRILGRLLGPLFALIDITGRANQGMSPAQAIIPAVFKALLTSGAAVLGGMVPIPGVNILTSIAGSFAGAWLGDQLMGGIDSIWDKSWDENLFKGFNNAVMGIGKADPTGLVSKIFPYEGSDKKYGSAQQSPTPSVEESSGSSLSGSTVPSIASPASSQMQVPGPVYNAGNTTVIYKKIGSSSSGQTTSPKPSKSSTNVPLIASANPDNFYTMYSQMIYNVVI